MFDQTSSNQTLLIKVNLSVAFVKCILLLILILFMLPSFGQEEVDQSKKTDSSKINKTNNNAGKNNKEIVTRSDISAIIKQLETISTNLTPDEQRLSSQDKNEKDAIEVGKSDLIEQRRMADSTRHIVILTFFSILIGIVSIILLYVNLAEARKATKAAEEANRQNRAWITITRTNFSHLPGTLITTNNQPFHFTIHWLNCGKSPALNVVIRGGHVVQKKIPDDIALRTILHSGNVAPNHTTDTMLSFDLTSVRSICATDTFVFMRILVCYETFNEKVETEEWIQMYIPNPFSSIDTTKKHDLMHVTEKIAAKCRMT